MQNYRFLVLRISVLFFEEGAEKIHHGNALGDGLELDRSMEGFGDVEGESFHFVAFDRALGDGGFWRGFRQRFGCADPFIELGLLRLGSEGDFFAGGLGGSFGGRSGEGLTKSSHSNPNPYASS